MAGIVLGIAGLVISAAVGEGAKAEMDRYVESMGVGAAFVRFGSPPGRPLEYKLSEVMGNSLVAVAAFHTSSADLRHDRLQITDARVIATGPDYLRATQLELSAGRFLSPLDSETRRLSVVLTESLVRALLPFGKVLGAEIRLDDRWYRVVGVARDDHLGPVAYVPLDAVSPSEYVVRFDSEASLTINLPLLYRLVETAASTASAAPEIVLPVEAMRDQQRLQTLLQRVLGGFAVVLLGLGAISVTNTQLMSVLTRHHEIGLRRALGATRLDIVRQFVIEALVICTLGSTFAVGMASVLVLGASPWLDWKLVINFNVVALALVAGIGVSAAAGALPALRASRIPPARVLA